MAVGWQGIQKGVALRFLLKISYLSSYQREGVNWLVTFHQKQTMGNIKASVEGSNSWPSPFG